MAIVIGYGGINGWLNGVGVGALFWLGFVATVLMGTVLWEGKSVKLYLINSIYQLINLIIMGIILSIWQ